MPSYSVARRADQDLVEIYIYGSERFGQAQAEGYNSELVACFRLLAEHPGIGRQKTAANHELRIFFFRRNVIAYQEAQSGIAIIRVLRGQQDWQKILEDE